MRVAENAVEAVPATTAIAPAVDTVIELTMWVFVELPRVQALFVDALTLRIPVVADAREPAGEFTGERGWLDDGGVRHWRNLQTC